MEQARVTVEVLDRLLDLDLDEATRRQAEGFLLEQAETLRPRELARAGQALIEALTVRPSVDDPADAAAVEREQEAAELAAQRAEWNTLAVTRRPGGQLRARLELGPLGAAGLLGWLTEADKPHPGTGGSRTTGRSSAVAATRCSS